MDELFPACWRLCLGRGWELKAEEDGVLPGRDATADKAPGRRGPPGCCPVPPPPPASESKAAVNSFCTSAVKGSTRITHFRHPDIFYMGR